MSDDELCVNAISLQPYGRLTGWEDVVFELDDDPEVNSWPEGGDRMNEGG